MLSCPDKEGEGAGFRLWTEMTGCGGDLMKKMAIVLGVFLFLIGVAVPGYCDDSKVIEKYNQYGGKTEEVVFHKGDDKYEDGISRIVEYYDRDDRIAEIESYYRDEASAKDGVFKREQYYKNKEHEKAKLTKAEFYFTDAHANVDGVFKSEIYYDDHERKEKVEYYYTPEYVKKKVLSKMVVFYEKGGDVSKRVYYDLSGRVIGTEGERGTRGPAASTN